MATRRGLSEMEEGQPGRSNLVYRQHNYSPLDSRIIIITAAILLFLITILFLNFFIRWVLGRLVLLRSPKPINLNKGLSKRQVQALPSFVYSSSKPLPIHKPSSLPPCGHPTFYSPFIAHPLSSQVCHVLLPTSLASTKVGVIDCQFPTKFEGCKEDHNIPSQLMAFQVHKVINGRPNKGGSLEDDQLVSTHVNMIDNEGPTNFGSLEVDHSLSASLTSSPKEEISNDAKCNEGNVIVDCPRKDDEMNASSISSCPICLVDFANGEQIRVLPTCQHYFHLGCIDLWLVKSSSCPTCRVNLLEQPNAPTRESTFHVQVDTAIPQQSELSS